ncbi:tail fiber protein [Xenorhabdus stockiae]|uniref:tail fiber protein n=1 Tax=Xenorhabdus stockiae TaxID=351614 RepID=UPI004063448D
MQPNKTNDAQLSEAIGQLVSDSKVPLTDSLGQSSVLAASQKLVNQVNDNANSRLEKVQNGADILDKGAFINNLDLTGTVEQAKNAIPKSFITQYSGNSPHHVISQDAVTRFLGEKLDKTGGQLTADDRFLLLQNQSGNTANYIEARGKDGAIRYRLGCMNSGTDVTLVNVAGKTTLAIHSSALYVNGDKVATEGAVKAGYASKVRIRRSREIETIKGRFPALYDGEVVTGVRGSYNDTFYEARNLQISIIEYLVDNEWVAAKNV